MVERMSEPYARDFELIGYHALEKRPAFKIAMQVVDDRWYLYFSHFWHCGWTILDVTDPANPGPSVWVPGPGNIKTPNIQVADGKMITALEWILPESMNLNPNKPFDEGIYVWDVADPLKPVWLSHFKTGGTGTHRNHYDGGRYVHLAAGVPGFAGNIYLVVDIDDPRNPREVGRWFLPEQYVDGGAKPRRRYALHGPAYVEGDRAYLGYGAGGMVILDVSDVRAPGLISRLDFGPAFGSGLGCHTVIPLPKRGLALVNNEAIEEKSEEPLNYAGIVDISDETKPRLLSLLPVPEPPPGAPFPNFQTRGGRFGPHNQHHWQRQPHLLNRDDIMYLTWFNGGLRVYDIRDPYLPKEIGCFLPPDPTERFGNRPKTALVTSTEDVLVDLRGYAYITDKNQGVYIVRYTGELA